MAVLKKQTFSGDIIPGIKDKDIIFIPGISVITRQNSSELIMCNFKLANLIVQFNNKPFY